MSSNPIASHVGPTAFKMVREVLRYAGLRGSKSDATSDVKRYASVFLTADYNRGVRTMSALKHSLAKHNWSAPRANLDPQLRGNAVDRRQDDNLRR